MINNPGSSSDTSSASPTHPTSFFDLKAKDKRHQNISMADFANKVILVVNVASKCGFTPQYKELEQLYRDFKDQGFVVLGFPCNQFGGQEPGSEQEIESFCQVNFGVTFPLMAKIDVNGAKEDPVYTFLKSQKAGLMGLTRIKWNFEKFLVNRKGKVVHRYSSMTSPQAIADDIRKLLGTTA
ncbi:Glutathione peroxidase 2 [Mortierella sp. GBA30]|nr:Glutathione peroxidase 2 [Mortierella sp. GBA30]